MKKGLRYLIFEICSLLILPNALLGSGISHSALWREHGSAPSDSLRTEVPLKIVYDGRMVTPLVEVFVNNKKVEAIFDSGSYGLRILSGGLKGVMTDSTSERVGYSYGDGKDMLRLRGQVQLANLQLGNLKSGHAIRIMSIDSTKYGPDADWTLTGDSARIQSHHFRSVSAIIGVGLRIKNGSKGVANPLAQLPGNGKYIIHFPDFGGTKGKLILNPDTVDLKGFTLFKLDKGKFMLPNDDSSWLDNELPGCIIISGSQACQNTMLDTGNPDIHVYSPNFSGNKSVTSRNQVTLLINDKTGGTAPVQTIFTVNDNREHGKDYVYLSEIKGAGKNIFGTRFFFDYDVLYDQVNGFIGIKKKL